MATVLPCPALAPPGMLYAVLNCVGDSAWLVCLFLKKTEIDGQAQSQVEVFGDNELDLKLCEKAWKETSVIESSGEDLAIVLILCGDRYEQKC